MRMRLAILAAFVLTACGSGSQAVMPEHGPRPDDTEAAVGVPDEAAPFRLPEGVTPTHYALSLRVDPAAETFSGRVEIDVTLAEASPRIWIHGRELAVSRVAITDASGEAVGSWQEVDTSEGMARVVFPRAVGPGAAHLVLEYTRGFDQTLEGLYHVAVGDDHYAFTQFEALSARRAFPCFDEPRFKVPFDITLTTPPGLRALANSRELETVEDREGGSRPSGEREGESSPAQASQEGFTRVRFATTEALPTYLVAFAVGPFDVVEATIPPNDVRTTPLQLRGIAPRGRGPEMAFAMEHTPRIVEALERWFAIPYPFDKLDIVAVPDFAAGAMENAGLVTFRDQLLLLSNDPPVAQQRGFAFVMAHELAHQWFGNLVTMQWWDDLWLNEAFATWMETAIVEATFPQFHAETLELTTQLEAFDADSLVSARVIRQPIVSSDDISNAFDGITYSKGASVLAMISHFMGPEQFQAGIRQYLRTHARGNATTADLVAALTAEGRNPNAAPILESFTTQAGIPLVSFGAIECGEDEGHPYARVAVSQSRYRPLGSSADASATWTVPVCVTHADRGGVVQESCTLLTGGEGTLEMPTCPAWIWPNPEGRSYYRFALSEASMTALAPQLRAALGPSRGRGWQDGARGGSASTRDLIALADSVRASVAAGAIDFGDAMTLLSPMAASEERFVALAPVELYTFAHDNLLTDETRPGLERHAQRLYAPQLRRLGWGPRAVRGQTPTEEPETRSLRASLLQFMAQVARDPAVRREARARGLAFLGEGPVVRGQGGDHQLHLDAVPTDLVEVSLIVAAEEGDAALFDRMLAELGRTTDGVLRQRLLAGLSNVDDDALRDRALALVLDPQLRMNERFRPLMAQFGDAHGREHALAWLEAHYDEVRALFGPEYAGYLPYALQSFCDRAHAEAGRAFFAPRVGDTNGGPRNLEAAVESVTLCAARAEAQRESASHFFAR
ncbi:MAG: M1 family metallopeptidase [Sandaracinaceae bacterium]|nr:M1 family metallopeptidase [Sandaracinaceae bacterium]